MGDWKKEMMEDNWVVEKKKQIRAICVIFWPTICPCLEKMIEGAFEENRLICLTEEIWRHNSIQAVAWLLFTDLIQDYRDNE